MNALKWTLFLPLAALLICVAQLVAGFIVQISPWWLGIPLVLACGVIVAIASILPVQMVSDPKIAATVLITLFVLFEGISLMGIASSLPTKELIGRVIVDIQIIAGAFAGTKRGGKEAI